MNIVIAPGNFKGSLTAIEVALAIEEGCLAALPEANIVRVPMADGGDGTLDCLMVNEKIAIQSTTVTNPLGEKINAAYGIKINNNQKMALIEMAKASGIHLIPVKQRNPLITSTYGTGELILQALNQGCRQFMIGLGGSATCDAGIGALAALGIQFKNHQNQEIEHSGRGLQDLAKIDVSKKDPRLNDAKFILACDINNALLGAKGAMLYIPQKGATTEVARRLVKNLENFSKVVASQFNKEIGFMPHGGAAGGLASGLSAFLNAELRSGSDCIIKEINLEETLKKADLVITAEGQIDQQSIYGKTPVAVAKLAKKFNIPVVVIAAKLGKGYKEIYMHGIDAAFSFTKGPISSSDCFRLAKTLIIETSYNIVRTFSSRIQNET